jgi:hypothetical protein
MTSVQTSDRIEPQISLEKGMLSKAVLRIYNKSADQESKAFLLTYMLNLPIKAIYRNRIDFYLHKDPFIASYKLNDITRNIPLPSSEDAQIFNTFINWRYVDTDFFVYDRPLKHTYYVVELLAKEIFAQLKIPLNAPVRIIKAFRDLHIYDLVVNEEQDLYYLLSTLGYYRRRFFENNVFKAAMFNKLEKRMLIKNIPFRMVK